MLHVVFTTPSCSHRKLLRYSGKGGNSGSCLHCAASQCTLHCDCGECSITVQCYSAVLLQCSVTVQWCYSAVLQCSVSVQWDSAVLQYSAQCVSAVFSVPVHRSVCECSLPCAVHRCVPPRLDSEERMARDKIRAGHRAIRSIDKLYNEVPGREV